MAIIARNTAATLAGQIVLKIAAFAFAVFVVRRLGAEDFGRYSAAMAYAFICAMLSDLGTSSLAVREMARQPEDIPWIVPNVMAIRAILSLFVIVATTMSAWWLGKQPDMVLGIFIASLGMLFYAFQGPLDALLIARERLYFSSLFNVFNQITFITLGTIALIGGAGYIGLLLAMLAGIAVMGGASYYVIRRVLGIQFVRPDPRRWRGLLWASLPFGIIGVIAEFSRRFDIVFMSFVLTYAAVGWFNVPFNLIVMMLMVAQSLALAIYPTMVRTYNSGRGSIQDTFQRAMRYLFLLSLPMAVGGTLLAQPIILTLYGANYSEAVPVMQVMVWALPSMFLAEILGRTSITMHLERRAAAVIAINAIITVGLDLLLIPRFGVIAATWVMVISQGINTLLSIIVIGPGLVFQGQIGPFTRVLLAGSVMGCAVWGLETVLGMSSINPLVALLVLVVSGALVYGIAVFAFRAISSGETQYLLDLVRSRVRRSN